jgi:hypothetical protein
MDPRCVMVNALFINPRRPIAPTDTTPSMENVFYANDQDGAIARDWTKQAANSTRERFYSMTTRSTIHLSLRKP